MSGVALRDTFLHETKELQSVLKDANAARRKSQLSQSTLDSVIELAHLRVVALFETFVEDLLHECLRGTSAIQGVLPKVTADDPDLLRDLVAPDGKFIALSRFQELSKKASSLMDGNPFSRLDYRTQDRVLLTEWIVVRNAIAHSSGPARQNFVALATQKRYPSRRPADYLTSILGQEQEGEIALARIRALATALTCHTESEADTHLLPERDFKPTDSPKAGLYTCKACGHARSLDEGTKLGSCLNCDQPQRCEFCSHKQTSNTLWRRKI